VFHALTLALTALSPTTAARISDRRCDCGYPLLLFIGAAVHHSRNNNDRPACGGWPAAQPACALECLRSIDTTPRLIHADVYRVPDGYRFTTVRGAWCTFLMAARAGTSRAQCMRNAGTAPTGINASAGRASDGRVRGGHGPCLFFCAIGLLSFCAWRDCANAIYASINAAAPIPPGG
jgi:hypothetical protein